MKESTSPRFKEFTKEQSQSERDTLATEIKEKRKTYFDRKRGVGHEISELAREAEGRRSTVEEQKKEIEAIESEIADRKRSKISEILNYFQLKKLREQLQVKTIDVGNFEEEYKKIGGVLGALEQSSDDRRELEEARNSLTEFYNGQNEKWNEYIGDLKAVDVGNVAEAYNVNFIHAIRPDFTPGSNSPLRGNVDWKTKLEIMLAFEPSISTSTIREGDSPDKMWGRMGVILKGGKVASAHGSDRNTHVDSINVRSGKTDLKRTKQDIEATLSITDYPGYNELVVENPEIAGFYICMDEREKTLPMLDLAPSEEVASALSKLETPVFVIKGGVPYKAEFDPTSKTFVAQERVRPADIKNFAPAVDKGKGQKIKERLFENSPFRIKNPEIDTVRYRAEGRKAYIEINFQNKYDKGLSDMSLVTEFPTIGSKLKYSIESGELVLHEIDSRTQKDDSQIVPLGKWFNDRLQSELTSVGVIRSTVSPDINNNEAYASEMMKNTDYLVAELDRSREKNDDKGIKYYENEINKLVSHLYGFAEQAGEMGDTETQTKAIEIASRYLGAEQFNEVIKRRIDNDGRLKISEEDLKSFE